MIPSTTEVVRGMDVGFELRGQVYIKLNLAQRYADQPGERTLGALGEELVVQPQRLLEALTSGHKDLEAANGAAFEALFERYNRIPSQSNGRPPSLSRRQKRDHLWHLATTAQTIETLKAGVHGKGPPRYHRWALPADADVVVPLSKGMVDVIERSRRWDAIAADVTAFETKLYELADAVIGLRKALSTLQRVGQHGLHEVGMLVGLSQYCGLLLDQQGNPGPGESPLADFYEFLVRSAIPIFIDKIVRNPVDIVPEAAKKRDRFAKKILRILDDASFEAGMRLVVDNHDIVPHRLLDDMYYYLSAAADLLSVTEQSEAFAERHALPMMCAVASLPADDYEGAIEEFGDEELKAGMKDGWRSVLSDRDTVFKLALGLGSGVIGSVSNLEGPRSLGVAVMMQYQIHLFRKAAKTYRYNVAAFDRAVNLFCKYFSSNDIANLGSFRQKVAEAIFSGKKVDLVAMAEKSGLKLDRGPFRGRGTRGVMALLSLSIFGLTLASGPDGSWKSRATLLSTGGTTALALLDFGPISDFLERRLRNDGFGKATRFLGRVVGIAGLAASGMSMLEAYKKGDDLGVAEGALATLGSASSLIGWTLATELGALALAPSLMMTVGSVLIAASLGISIWRLLSPEQPTDIVNASIEHFQQPNSRASIAELEPTVDTLATLANKTNFQRLDPSYKKALASFGYDDKSIAILVR